MPFLLQADLPTGLADLREPAAVLCLLFACACVVPSNGPQPSITSLTPGQVCAGQSAPVDIHGSNFSPLSASNGVGLRLPSVQLVQRGGGETLALDGATSHAITWQSTEAMTFLAPGQGLPAGIWDVRVINPGGDAGAAPTPLWVQGAPTLTSVSGDDGCASAPHDRLFTLMGSNFVVQGNQSPSVQIDGHPLTPSWNASSCVEQAGPQAVSVCTRLTVQIPASFASGSHTLTVQNPPQNNSCDNTPASAGLQIDGVVPAVTHPTAPGSVSLCAGGGSLAINGNFLSANATVQVGASLAPRVVGNNCVANADSCTNLVASFGAITAASPAPLAVQNPGSCALQVDNVVNVLPGPQLFGIDPPAVYDSMPNTLTLFVHGATGTISSVTATNSGSATALTLCGGGGSSPPCTAQALQASSPGDQALALTLPAGSLNALAAGGTQQTAVTLELHTSDSTCSAFLPAGLIIAAAQPEVTLAISPNTAQPGQNRSVTVSLTDPRIQPGARLYYASSTYNGAFIQTAFVDKRTLTAVVPSIDLGNDNFADVDVVLVNPDGSVYIQSRGLRLLSVTAPTLTDMNGATVSASGGTLITPATNLDANATATLINCRDKLGQPQPNLALSASLSGTSLQLMVPQVPTAPQRCQLMVNRGTDGAQAFGGAVFISESASSMPATRDAQQPLRVGRRGHGMTVSYSDPLLHTLIVAGGDMGQGPIGSVETAAIGPTGAPGPWVLSPYSLRTPRTNMALLRVGNTTVYAMGGTDAGGNSVTTLERAVVLNASDAPTNLQAQGFDYGGTTKPGLSPGAWSYAVSLLYSSNDALFPCGESIASAVYTVNVPSVPAGFIPSLTWSIPSSHRPLRGVRVYRSALNAGTSSLHFLADVAASDSNNLFTDSPTQTQVPAAMCPPAPANQTPLGPGSLSPWTQLATQLTRARIGGSFAVATHNSTRTSHLLAVGGINNFGVPQQDYEYLNLIAVDGTTPDQWELAQSFTAAPLPMAGGTPCAAPTARVNASTCVLNANNSSRDGTSFAITDESQYLVLGPGLAANAMNVAAVDGWLVASNGQLQDVGSHVCLTDAAAASQSVALGIRGQVVLLGGTGLSSSIRTVPWTVSSAALRVTPPDADNGTVLAAPRTQAAGVSNGGYFYLTGGSASPLPQGSVEYGMW